MRWSWARAELCFQMRPLAPNSRAMEERVASLRVLGGVLLKRFLGSLRVLRFFLGGTKVQSESAIVGGRAVGEVEAVLLDVR